MKDSNKADVISTTDSELQTKCPPRVINLGRVRKDQVKKLKNAHGKLMEDISQIVEAEIAKMPEPDNGKVYQPVVLVYHRKIKKSKRKVKVLGATIDRKRLRKSGIGL